ncbi:MAG: DUF6223 family protein [Blastocatellia bacterium]
MKMKSILSGLIVVCAACMFLAASCSQASNVRYLIDDARASVDFYTIHLGFAVDLTEGVIGITNGRARAIVAAVVGLISLVVGGLALARSAGRIGAGNGRAGAIVALALGLIGMVLSVAHLGSSTGGFGAGSGRAGAIVALVLGLIGMNLGGLALARSRRSRRAA